MPLLEWKYEDPGTPPDFEGGSGPSKEIPLFLRASFPSR